MKEYRFKINGKEYDVTINSIEGNVADVTVNGANHKVEIQSEPSAPAASSSKTPVQVKAEPAVEQKPAAATPSTGSTTITSPLPGVIIDVCVKEGQVVKAGQKVAVLEAMKMENEILSEKDGTVAEIHVSKGVSVLEGANIVTIG